MRTLINAIGMVVLVAVIVIFCVINMGRADLNLLYPSVLDWNLQRITLSLPLCALVLAPLGLGIILGCLLEALMIFRLKRDVRALKKELHIRAQQSAPGNALRD